MRTIRSKSARRRISSLPTRPRNFRPLLEQLEDRLALATVFGLTDANELIEFDSASPGTIISTTPITGVTAAQTLVGIDFRPQNGFLYGLGVDSDADRLGVYSISFRTGVATKIAGDFGLQDNAGFFMDLPDTATTAYGFDFNPAVDRIRVTTSTGLNFRVNPNSGLPVDGDFGGAANSFPGDNPDGNINGAGGISAAAYTNNQPNNGNITTLYTLDDVTNSLFIQNPPNAGTQSAGQVVTFGGNPLDFSAVNGFDIQSGVNALSSNAAVTTGSAFAALNVGGTTGLYSINLVNAQATLVGNLGAGATAIKGLAIRSDLGGFPAIALDGGSPQNLLRFNTATPGTITTVPTSGLTAGEVLVGIDYRPQTGQLLGLGINESANTGTVYRIDPQTGVLTATGNAGIVSFVGSDGSTPIDFPAASAGYGLDFNPSVDRIRVTTQTGLNFRLTPDGTPVDGDAAASGVNLDGNINGFGVAGISASAYTNSFGQTLGAGGATTLYTFDVVTNKALYIQNPPNAGTQTAPVAVTVNGSSPTFSAVNGFDIPADVRVTTSNSAATGLAFAALTDGTGVRGLYSINLATGAATNLGIIASSSSLAGFALGDNPAPAAVITPTVSITDVTMAEGNAGTTAFTFTVTLSNPSSQTVTVSFQTSDDTATVADGDYAPNAGTLTFAPNDTTETITVLVNGDTKFEVNSFETFFVNLLTATNAVIADPQGQGTITNDDPIPTVSIGDVTLAEGNAGTTAFVFTATLTNPSSQAITVPYTTNDGTATVADGDYVANAGSITFPPNTTTQTITVLVNGDTKVEMNETFTVTLNPTVGALAGDTSGQGNITNDDVPPTPAINLVKLTNGTNNNTAPGPTLPVGSTATFTYVVTNTGNVPLSGVVVEDDNGTPASTADDFNTSFVGGDTNGNGLLDQSETWNFSASRIVTAGQYTNVGEATGSPPPGAGAPVSDTDVENHFGQSATPPIQPQSPGTAGLFDDPENPDEFVLVVTGTAKSDSIVIKPVKGQVQVFVNGRNIRSVSPDAFGRIVVFAGAGNDSVVIAASISVPATIFGEAGNDSIVSGNGSDFLFGGPGKDVIVGNGGDDEISGEDGNDVLKGGAGDDTMTGGTGNDVMTGDAGNDTMNGDENNDVVKGGSGDDTVSGDDGNDTVTGDSGNDTVSGGSGKDTVLAGSGDDIASGGEGNDVVAGESGNDIVTGDDGNDIVKGGSGNDIVSGGEGNDKVFGEAGNDFLLGDGGNDQLFGGAGRDILVGGEGADTLYGEAGDDILVGGTTSADADEAAAAEVFAVWTAPNRSYNQRVADLADLNITIFDDGAVDNLFGQGNQDLFLADLNDRVRDKAKNELIGLL